jgi:hypothetical protein
MAAVSDRRGVMLCSQPRDPRRLLEQFGQELPCGVSQQEQARQPQQEPGLSRLSVGPRHDDAKQSRRVSGRRIVPF